MRAQAMCQERPVWQSTFNHSHKSGVAANSALTAMFAGVAVAVGRTIRQHWSGSRKQMPRVIVVHFRLRLTDVPKRQHVGAQHSGDVAAPKKRLHELAEWKIGYHLPKTLMHVLQQC